MVSHRGLPATGTFVLGSKSVSSRVSIRQPIAPAVQAVARQRIRCARTLTAAAGSDGGPAIAEPAPQDVSVPSTVSDTAGDTVLPETSSRAGGSGRGDRAMGGRGRGRGLSSGGRGRGRGRPAPTVSDNQILPGAEFDGTISSLQAYGAFVDFGGRINGLVHISQIADSYVETVSDVVNVGQSVRVRVISTAENKVSLSMKSTPVEVGNTSADEDASGERPRLGKVAKRGGGSSAGGNKRQSRPTPKVKAGETVMATVQRTTPYGVFLDLDDGTNALLHINQMANPDKLDNPQPRQLVNDGQKLEVRVLSVKDGKIDVTQQTAAEAKLDAELSKGVGTVKVGDDASPFAFMLARAGVQRSDFGSNDTGSEGQTVEGGNGNAAAASAEAPLAEATGTDKAAPSVSEPQATATAETVGAGAAASAGVIAPAVAAKGSQTPPATENSVAPKDANTTKAATDEQIAAAGETVGAGAAAEAGVVAPAVAAQDNKAAAESAAKASPGSAVDAASDSASTAQLAAAGETAAAAADAGLSAPTEAKASTPAAASKATSPKATKVNDDTSASKAQLAAAGETPGSAEPEHDVTPTDAEAHEKATQGSTHLQAAAAGEAADKV